MKVNIYETVEVSDEDRKRIAALLGQKTASREELKAFIWKHGADWQAAIRSDNPTDEDLVGGVTDEDVDEQATDEDLVGAQATDEDLIGGSTDEDLI